MSFWLWIWEWGMLSLADRVFPTQPNQSQWRHSPAKNQGILEAAEKTGQAAGDQRVQAAFWEAIYVRRPTQSVWPHFANWKVLRPRQCIGVPTYLLTLSIMIILIYRTLHLTLNKKLLPHDLLILYWFEHRFGVASGSDWVVSCQKVCPYST